MGKKAQVYGNRWKTLADGFGSGGQADVFRVVDLNDPNKTEYALKRLKNVDRKGRFEDEIAAVCSIDHANVVKIIDSNSADVAASKPWFVMPVASGNLEQRRLLYKGNLDSVLQVAIQLADALIAAHQLGIVHRDVKPANVLFKNLDHVVWLSDFGICHQAKNEKRYTELGEVVGPKNFTAPELEDGGQLEVTAAADVYSLGKVIFYMLSGGNFIAREKVDGPEYDRAFGGGERFRLLKVLLEKMIAPLNRRITSMTQVRAELLHIQNWDTYARDLALSPETLSAIDAVHSKTLTRIRVDEKNLGELADRRKVAQTVSQSILDWLVAELTKTKVLLEASGVFKCEIGASSWDNPNGKFTFRLKSERRFTEIGNIEMAVIDSSINEHWRQQFKLKLFVCAEDIYYPAGQNNPQLLPEDSPEMAFCPYYMEFQPPYYKDSFMRGFFRDENILRQVNEERTKQRRGAALPEKRDALIARTFPEPPVGLLALFPATAWPDNRAEIGRVFSEAFRTFVSHMSSDSEIIDD